MPSSRQTNEFPYETAPKASVRSVESFLVTPRVFERRPALHEYQIRQENFRQENENRVLADSLFIFLSAMFLTKCIFLCKAGSTSLTFGLVIVNRDPMLLDSMADVILRSPLGDTLVEFDHRLNRLGSP